jgi:hypothetical protein
MLMELGGVGGGIGKAIRLDLARRLLTDDFLERLRARQHCEGGIGAKRRHFGIDTINSRYRSGCSRLLVLYGAIDQVIPAPHGTSWV